MGDIPTTDIQLAGAGSIKKHALTKPEGVIYSSDYFTHKSTDKVALKQHIISQHEGKVENF